MPSGTGKRSRNALHQIWDGYRLLLHRIVASKAQQVGGDLVGDMHLLLDPGIVIANLLVRFWLDQLQVIPVFQIFMVGCT